MTEQAQTGESKAVGGKTKEAEVRVELVTNETPQSRKNEDTSGSLPEPDTKETRSLLLKKDVEIEHKGRFTVEKKDKGEGRSHQKLEKVLILF